MDDAKYFLAVFVFLFSESFKQNFLGFVVYEFRDDNHHLGGEAQILFYIHK